jgi:peptidoglycan/xylan/chitin deacetylase (PgdA/CDA1 family)
VTPFAAAAVTLLLAATAWFPPPLAGRELERLPTRKRELALTIDGGDNAAAAASMLRALRVRRVPATFFLTGRFVERYPRLARAIGRAFPIANHSYSHTPMTRLSSAAVTADIARAGRAIRRATGRDPRPLFRFPYGDRDRRTIAIANRLGYVSIRWSIDTWGWMGVGRQSAAGIVRKVVAGLEPGAIVMMHLGAARDGSTLDARALPAVIDAARRRGYEFTTLERLRRP